MHLNHDFYVVVGNQGRKRPLDTPNRMIERRRVRERKVEGEMYVRDIEIL